MYIMHHSGLLVASREYSSESYYAHRIGVLLLEDESLSISGLARFILNIIRFCRFGLFTYLQHSLLRITYFLYIKISQLLSVSPSSSQFYFYLLLSSMKKTNVVETTSLAVGCKGWFCMDHHHLRTWVESISTKFLRHCNSATSHVNKWVPALLSGSQPSNCTSPYVRLTGLLRIFFDTCLGWFVSEMGCTANKTNGPARPGSTWFPWWLLSPYTEPQGVFCNCIFYFIFKFKIIF